MYRIVILSKDALFSRMLKLELDGKFGAEAVISEESKNMNAELYIADADGGFARIPYDIPVIAFGTKDRGSYELSDNAVFFKRPFLIKDFLSSAEEMLSCKNEDGGKGLTVHRGKAFVDNNRIALTDTEFSVLTLLYDNKGKTVSRDDIKRVICKKEKNAAASNCADVYIRFLRKKLEEPYNIRIIRTVRGKGYTID